MPLWMALHHIHVPSEMQGSFFKFLQATFCPVADQKCDRKAHVQNANRGRTFGLHFCTRGTRLRRIRLYVRGGFRGRGILKMMRDPLKRVRGHRKRSCSQFYDREKGRQEPASSSKRFYGAVSLSASVHAEGTSPICKSARRRYVPEFACGRGTSPMCMCLRAHCVAMGKGAFSRPPFGISYRPCVSKGRPCAPRVAGSRKYEGVSHVRTF